MAAIDLGAVWHDTRALVARQRVVLANLAGTFLVLPAMVVGVLTPTPQLFSPIAARPVPNLGQNALLFAVSLLTTYGLLAVIAIAADPAEGEGRTLGELLAGVLPAWRKWLRLIVYVVLGMVLIVIGLIILVAAAGVGARIAGVGRQAAAVAGILVLLSLGPAIWAWARLTPLFGVLVRESLSASASVSRAWRLSRGVAAKLVVVRLLMLAVVLPVTGLMVFAQLRLGVGRGAVFFALLLIRSVILTTVSVYVYAAFALIYRRLADAAA